MLTNTNIWELYWILSSQMTKTFRDNCDKNIVQQTSCEPLLPMFKCKAVSAALHTPNRGDHAVTGGPKFSPVTT